MDCLSTGLRKIKPSASVGLQSVLFHDNKDWASWIAKKLYIKYKHVGIELEECEQNAFEALLKCIQTFNSEKCVKFRTYAEYRIKGAIINSIPTINEQASFYKRREELKQADNSELSNIDLNSPITSLVSLIQTFTIDTILSEVDQPIDDGLEGFSSPEYFALLSTVKTLIHKLPSPKDIVLILHYFKGSNLTNISELLNLSKGRVSQLHSEAIKELAKLVSRSF